MPQDNPLSIEALDATIIAQLTEEERQRSAVYVNQSPLPAGSIKVGGSMVTIDHPSVMAFIDRMPGATWMHPCRYLLIDQNNKQIVFVDSDRPPVFGPLPPTWRIAWKSPGVSDWQLIRIATEPTK